MAKKKVYVNKKAKDLERGQIVKEQEGTKSRVFDINANPNYQWPPSPEPQPETMTLTLEDVNTGFTKELTVLSDSDITVVS